MLLLFEGKGCIIERDTQEKPTSTKQQQIGLVTYRAHKKQSIIDGQLCLQLGCISYAVDA